MARAIAAVLEIRVVEVDPDLYAPMLQALEIVQATKRRADAEAFTRFVPGDEVQASSDSSGPEPRFLRRRSKEYNERRLPKPECGL